MHTQIWRFWKHGQDFWWSMVGKCRDNITFLIWWCGGVLRHSSAGKAAWDLSSCKDPGTAGLLASYQDVFFRDSLWTTSLMSLLPTQLVFLTHSQFTTQSQLQLRITVILTGLKRQYPTKPETSRGGPLVLATQLPLPSLGLQGTRTTLFFKAEHLEKQGPSVYTSKHRRC